MSFYGISSGSAVGGPSYIPFNSIMLRPFGVPQNWRQGPSGFGGNSLSSSIFGNQDLFGKFNFGNFGRFSFRSSSMSNNPFAASTSGANINGLRVGAFTNGRVSGTGIYNPDTGTRFGQLTTRNGVKTRLSGDIENYSQRVERNPFATNTITKFEDDKYRYTVRNTKSNGWIA